MESSPLIKAHDHAKAASNATQASDTTTAIAEHALAAGEFANAAKTTGSVEALRTLRLLEQHHKRLSELLKFPIDLPSQQSTADSDIPEEDEKDIAGEQEGQPKATKPTAKESSSATVAASVKPVPTLRQQGKYHGRELSSSIASNLASARGIKSKYRGQPLAPSISNDQAPGSLEARPRRDGSLKNKVSDGTDGRKPSWVPPTQQGIKEDVLLSEPSPTTTPADEGFSRFYNTFGSLINKLSAPLAFAGLPLIAEESSTSEAAPMPPTEPALQKKPRHQKPSVSGAEPDLSKLYSRAALRSIRGSQGGDSFYVVPTSGHTASYASILNHESKEKRRLAASRDDADLGDEQDDDDFVDARESQPMLPGLRKRAGAGRSKTERDLQNMVEELHTENASLKEMLDKLSKRLHAFELNSQSAHLALAQSVRLQRPGSPMSSSVGPVDEALKRRNRELEEQMVALSQKMGSMEKDYDKLQQTVDKYRERWEKLKAGAKARREAQDMAGDGEPGKSSR